MNAALLAIVGMVILLFSGLTNDNSGTDSSNDSGAASMTAAPDAWTRFDFLFHSYGDTYGVDWTWLKAFALNESNLGRESSVARGLNDPSNVEASKSSDGKSWGLMQVTLGTARGLDPQTSAELLNDPDYSVNLAAKYIAQLQRMFSRNDPRFTEYVVKSYNQGPGNTMKEASGVGGGFANDYWDRWQRNLTQVEENIA